MMRYEERLIESLRPGCERIEITGPSRRNKFTGSTDILCVPRLFQGIFKDPDYQFDGLRETIDSLVRGRTLEWQAEPLQEPVTRYALRHIRDETNVTIHAIRGNAQWGVVMFVKTGPEEYVEEIIHRARERGYVYSPKGYMTHNEIVCLMPSERDLFRASGTAFISPNCR